MRNLDQLDLDILAHLFRDAGMTNKDLAALVGVAPSTCLERVRKLQQDGVLKGAHCEVDHQALGGLGRLNCKYRLCAAGVAGCQRGCCGSAGGAVGRPNAPTTRHRPRTPAPRGWLSAA